MKKLLFVVLVGIISFLFYAPCLAQETLTITTYYPSPYGSYRELRAERVALGYLGRDEVCWDPPCIGTGVDISDSAGVRDLDLLVEGSVIIGTIPASLPSPMYSLMVRSNDASKILQSWELGTGMAPRAIMKLTDTDIEFGASSTQPFHIITGGSRRITTDVGGNVGIGTSLPGYRLDVRTPGSGTSQVHVSSTDTNTGGYLASASDSSFYMSGGANFVSGSGWIARSPQAFILGGSSLGIRMFTDALLTVGKAYIPSERMRIDLTTGNVGIGTVTPGEELEVNGDILANSFLYSSDERLKKDISSLSNALLNLTSINGISFHWKDASKGEGRQIGLIAQEVEKVFPEVVVTSGDGYKAIDYAKLIPVLIEAIKEQQTRISSLEQRLQGLE